MREYRTVDKSTWARGPWDTEPDKMQWRDEATGLDCLYEHDSPRGVWPFNGTYRDLAYVREQCASLASQLATLPAPALAIPVLPTPRG